MSTGIQESLEAECHHDAWAATCKDCHEAHHADHEAHHAELVALRRALDNERIYKDAATQSLRLVEAELEASEAQRDALRRHLSEIVRNIDAQAALQPQKYPQGAANYAERG